MAYSIATVTRNYYGDYLSAVSESPSYALMGLGVVQVDENPGAKIDKTPFVNNINTTGTITGYERTFPFDVQLRTGEAAIMKLYDIYRGSEIGADAELYYVRADLFETPVTSTYQARRFKVAVEVTSVEGAGMEIIHIKGNFHQVGDYTEGTFNPTTLAFVADA